MKEVGQFRILGEVVVRCFTVDRRTILQMRTETVNIKDCQRKETLRIIEIREEKSKVRKR